MSSPWFISFAYVIVGDSSYCLLEFLWSGGTLQGWWNDLRIWLYKRTSSYLFAFLDTILNSFGFSASAFAISAKVAEENASLRYEKEIMESPKCSVYLQHLQCSICMSMANRDKGKAPMQSVKASWDRYAVKVFQRNHVEKDGTYSCDPSVQRDKLHS
ncbi:hypothetical protein RJT34_12788 [Clitoria ternatea]|uniref:Uncharacterized protein n=1 Tax=Clitoria ternatea TaxID=43366 RepID=A0AAN9PKV4_CLITE